MSETTAGSRGSSAGATEDEERALIRRIGGQERDAFELLYRIYYRRLMRFLDRVMRRPQMIEEILDDTMLVVWHKAATFNGASQVSTWIFAIAYKKAMKALNRERRRMLSAVDQEEPSYAPSLETVLIDGETSSALRRLVAGLSAEQRAVVELTYFHGFAYKEIAEILECPVDTVKTRMFHARRKLRIAFSAKQE
jgi:RNA polymerase sigma-70 factor (ECF subfamily)